MPAECKSFSYSRSVVAIILKKIFEFRSILNFPSHVLHNTHCKFPPYFRNKFTVDNIRHRGHEEVSYCCKRTDTLHILLECCLQIVTVSTASARTLHRTVTHAQRPMTVRCHTCTQAFI